MTRPIEPRNAYNDALKEMGLDDNTIVWYSTDNGPEHASWPHGATTLFCGEKMTTYEGGVRVISMIKWPGKIKTGQELNGKVHSPFIY